MNSRICLEKDSFRVLVFVPVMMAMLISSFLLLAQRTIRLSDWEQAVTVGVGLGISLVCVWAAIMKKRLAQ